MRTTRVATAALLAGALAFVLVPMAFGTTHSGAIPSVSGSNVTAMDHGNGCGYEHGPHAENGTDGNHDDNNGVGNDEDGDHDCSEQDTD